MSIVIPTWNGRELLEKHLPSVIEAASHYQNISRQEVEILVVDDAGSDRAREWLPARFPDFPGLRVETNARNLGFAPTANRGIRLARHPLVYLLNNDISPDLEALPPLIAHFEKPHVFAVASEVYDFTTRTLCGAGQIGEFRRGFLGVHRRYFAEEHRLEANEPPWLTMFATGGSSMFRRDSFLQLGGFDEDFAPFGWEDVEMSLRAWKQGWEAHYEPRSRVYHEFSSTIAPRFPRRKVRAVYERNRLMGHWIHLDSPRRLAAHAAFLALKLAGSAVSGRWEQWKATGSALARLGSVRAKRKAYHARQQRSLIEVLRLVAAQARRPGAAALQ